MPFLGTDNQGYPIYESVPSIRSRFLLSRYFAKPGFMGKPSFYKILTGDFTKKLQIPQLFLKYFKGVLPQECVLRNPVGRSWVVKLVEVDNCIFLYDSWGKFVKDHSLEWGDFITFTYDESFEFHVEVFEKTGCEVDYAVTFANRTSKGSKEVLNKLNGHGDECGESSLNGKSQMEIKMEDDVVPEPDEEIFILQSLHSHKQRIKNPTKGAESSHRVAQKRENGTARGGQKPNKVGVIQRDKAQSHRDCSFSVTLCASYVSSRAYLHIPTYFSRSYFLGEMEKVVLLVSDGKVSRRWAVKYFSDASSFSSGWSKFVRDNHLKADDVCSFEAVPGMVNTLSVVIHRKRKSPPRASSVGDM